MAKPKKMNRDFADSPWPAEAGHASAPRGFDFCAWLVDNGGVMRTISARATAALCGVLFLAMAWGCHGTLIQGRTAEPPTPATLEAARRLTYVILQPTAVTAAPQLTVPGPMVADLEVWVRKYMIQVGLNVLNDPTQPHDAEVRLTMTVNGAAVLMRGNASLEVLGKGETIARFSTEEQIEPPGSFARSLALDLVESLVHSTSVAEFAGASPGGNGGRGGAEGAGGGGAAGGGRGQAVVAIGRSPERSGAPAAQGGRVPVILPAEAPGERVAAAKEHARQGSAYYDVGRWAQAYTEFEQAYLLEQDPALLYNMGQCQRKLGNTQEAVQFFRAYLRRAPQGSSAADAEKRIRELEGESATKPKK